MSTDGEKSVSCHYNSYYHYSNGKDLLTDEDLFHLGRNVAVTLAPLHNEVPGHLVGIFLCSFSVIFQQTVTFPFTLIVFSPIFIQEEKQSPCSKNTPCVKKFLRKKLSAWKTNYFIQSMQNITMRDFPQIL